MRRAISFVAGLAAVGCMVASNMMSSGSNERLHALGRAGMQLGKTEAEVDRLRSSGNDAETDAAEDVHMEALDDYKGAFSAANLPAGGAELLGYAALFFLIVSVGAAWKRDRISPK